MPVIWWVALGSGAGGTARLLVGWAALKLAGPGFPWGVLAVNLAGCLAIGWLARATAPGARLALPPAARLALMAGLCGGFTTFSLFSLETWWLWQADRWLAAALYSGLTLFGGLLLTATGWWLAGRATSPGAVEGGEPR